MVRRLVCLLIAWCQIGIAAGPMTHLYLGEKYCEALEIGEDAGDFLRGTLYPDIRYVAHFPRDLTHPPITDIKRIQKAPTPFHAGIEFHAWVDLVREEFVVSSGIYQAITSYAEGHEATFLKLLEEEVLAELYDGRKWSFLFDQCHAAEKTLATESEIEKWHTMLQYSMSYRPSWLIWGVSYFKDQLFGISNDTLYRWSYLLVELAREPLFRSHVLSLLAFIESKLPQDKIEE